MSKVSRASLALLAVLFFSTAITAVASASRSINFSPTGANRAVGTVTISSPEFEFVRIRCLMTLTLANIAGGAKSTATVHGNVTGATASECEGATVRVLSPSVATPWRITYQNFTGTLPSIEGMGAEIRGTGFLFQIFGTNCLYGGLWRVIWKIVKWTIGAFEVWQLIRDLGSFPACPRTVTKSGELRFERSVNMTLA